ncbi:MAG: NarK/NasA family nitrate transporter [Bacteroidia bacterium]|nr:NarK/NasA family nitrate transporter [Bacteroidia bacterium]
MEEKVSGLAHRTLFLNTTAFVICFAAWMLNGVLVTFLVDKGIFNWGPIQVGWLLGIPVLTGSLFRLPMGILTDKFGGKWVFGLLLMFCSVPMYLLSYADDFLSFAILSFFTGIVGSGFAVGVAYTSVWYPKKWQGTALGIVGAGNAGAAITTMFAPALLNKFTGDGTSVDQWKLLPQIYAFVLFGMSIVYLLFAKNKRPEGHKTLSQLIKPIKNVRVWRFGLYYFLVFGCFVAFSQWLVPYFVNVYGVSLVTAGFFASLFSFPSGVIRVLGGWLSDKWGARKVMYWVLGSSLCISFFLIIPRMELITPGAGIMASAGGEVRSVSDTSIQVGDKVYPIKAKVTGKETFDRSGIFPQKEMWHEVVVKQGQIVEKKQLLAKASTCIFFQANIWVFAILVTIIGAIWGIGKAAVYKHIPEYFPEEVGMVGGLVGVIGGMGGFLFPILFGYLLQYTGFWTSSWILMWILSGVCLIWMHRVITRMMNREAPHLAGHLEPLPKNNE